MLFTTINGEQYTIDINFEVCNDYNSFKKYITNYLFNLNEKLREKLYFNSINYIYKENIINSLNYSWNDFIKEYDDTKYVSIVFYKTYTKSNYLNY